MQTKEITIYLPELLRKLGLDSSDYDPILRNVRRVRNRFSPQAIQKLIKRGLKKSPETRARISHLAWEMANSAESCEKAGIPYLDAGDNNFVPGILEYLFGGQE